jgi:hypothetical protein
MKITQDYTEADRGETIEVVSAEYKHDYDLKVTFSDGIETLIDFRPFLSKSLNPSIAKYRDKNLFRNFEIVSGNLNWNDYDLIFPVEDLYQGKII